MSADFKAGVHSLFTMGGLEFEPVENRNVLQFKLEGINHSIMRVLILGVLLSLIFSQVIWLA